MSNELNIINNKKTIAAIIISVLLIIIGSLVINTVLNESKNVDEDKIILDWFNKQKINLEFKLENITFIIWDFNIPEDLKNASAKELFNITSLELEIEVVNDSIFLRINVFQPYIELESFDFISANLTINNNLNGEFIDYHFHYFQDFIHFTFKFNTTEILEEIYQLKEK